VFDMGGLLDVVLHGRDAWRNYLVPPRPPVAGGPVDYYRPAPNFSGRVGLKASFNLATVTGGNAPGKFSYRDGFSTGAMADFNLNSYLSLHPELLFSQKGARYDETDANGARFAGKLRLNYFDLPVLLRARAPGGLFAEVGPQLGYLVGQKTESTEYLPGQDPRATSRVDMAGRRRLELGYVAGVGYQLPQGLEVSARYNGGLADLNDPASGPALHNALIQLQIGYLFK